LSQRTVLEAEPIGDILLGVPFQKDGAQRLVLTVIRLGGLGEELPATGVIHDHSSLEKMSVDFVGQIKGNGKVKLREGRYELP